MGSPVFKTGGAALRRDVVGSTPMRSRHCGRSVYRAGMAELDQRKRARSPKGAFAYALRAAVAVEAEA